jgi:hypothetical protein
MEATISFVVCGVSKKDALYRPRSKFVGNCGGKVRITSTSKNPKVTI